MLPLKTASKTQRMKLAPQKKKSCKATIEDMEDADAPETQHIKSVPLKKKPCKATIKEVEDEDSPYNISVHNHASPGPDPSVLEMSGNIEGNGRKV
jgi:hypothetical protein